MNKALEFNESGLLQPSSKILTSLQVFEEVFVDSYPHSKTRKILFNNYLAYLERFSKRISSKFTHWVDGSFVTAKDNPNDIDFVVFIASDIFERKETILEDFWSFSLENEGLDAYIVKVYPTHNELHQSVTQLFSFEWHKRFTHTKSDEQGQIYRKGFIEIKFDRI